MELIKGQKIKLNQIIEDMKLIMSCNIEIGSGNELDMCCIGVDNEEKLSDDRYFIFYNALSSPEGAIIKEEGVNKFHVDLSKVPEKIKKIVLCISIDGNGTMKEIQNGKLIFINNNNKVSEFSINSENYSSEKSIILCEIYLKDGIWRLAMVNSGFNGGLGDILRNYGGEEEEDDGGSLRGNSVSNSDENNILYTNTSDINSSESQNNSQSPSLVTEDEKRIKAYLEKKKNVEKIVLEKAPHLIDLTKKVTVTLEKKKMENITANVVVVLDRSGSMNRQYKRGDVQRAMDKFLPIALMFDDDGQIDSWTFANKAKQLSPLSLDNIKDYIKKDNGGWKLWNVGGCNDETVIIEEIMNLYKKNTLPVYVIFISDGGIYKKGPIKKCLIKSSNYPIFWQFMGLGGSNYGILEELDTMKGRVVDNANFFSIDNIDSMSDEQLYDKLLNEFPVWFKEAKAKGII